MHKTSGKYMQIPHIAEHKYSIREIFYRVTSRHKQNNSLIHTSLWKPGAYYGGVISTEEKMNRGNLSIHSLVVKVEG